MEAPIHFPTNIPIPVQVFGRERKMKEFKAKVVLGLSISQIVIGCLCIVLMALAMGVHSQLCFRGPCLIGYGIQAGVMYCISGILGCCSSKFKTNKCLIIAVMVMNILSAAFAIIPLVFAPIDLSFRPSYMGLFAFAFIISLVILETFIAIVTSAFCCKFVCGCCSNEAFYPSYAFYDTKTQQFVFLPGRQDISSSGVSSLSQNPDWFNPMSSLPSDKESTTGGEVSSFDYSRFK